MANNLKELEMFYLNSTLNFGIPPVLVFQLEVYYKLDRLLTGPTAQQNGTTALWYSNKTSLPRQNITYTAPVCVNLFHRNGVEHDADHELGQDATVLDPLVIQAGTLGLLLDNVDYPLHHSSLQLQIFLQKKI